MNGSIEKIDELASVYQKKAIAPAAIAAGTALEALKGSAVILMYAWMASGIAEYLTRKNPALANVKEALAELLALVAEADQSKMSPDDKGIIAKFVSSAKAILPQIDRVRSIKTPSADDVQALQQFVNDARFVAYNAQNVANIMDKIETWYSGVGSFLAGTFGFGFEITDVRKAKARANEVGVVLGQMISGIEILLEKTVNQAQQMAAAQKAKPAATPGDQVSEFATLMPA